ncbi:MAG: HesA/MoeB/ThiF family protein [Candidatus Micrarchaeia archaeon]
MELTNEELQRYARQIMMDGWGIVTQKKLKNSKVFIAGAGGLGSPVAIYLAVAGVGNIRICDYDTPDITNLNRQILHNHKRFGINKAISAKMTLEELNPNINIEAIPYKITEDNIEDIIDDSEIIIDCMDNFATRYILNKYAIKKNLPLVHGSIWGFEGRVSFIKPPETPCLRCLFPEAPPEETFPVLGVTPGIIGAIQAAETIKYLTGIGKLLKNVLLVWSGYDMSFKQYKGFRDPKCIDCSSIQK